jgi:tricorn protease
LCCAGVLAAGGVADAGDAPLLLRFPSISETQIVFNYAGTLWIVGREGGEARLLVSGPRTASLPHFSPDGSLIAFTADQDGNRDVYVVPAMGGVPKRLTYHPAEERVRGFAPDGTRVLFSSRGASFESSQEQLYTVPVQGGFPTRLPLPSGEEAAFSPDAQQLAYVPHMQWQAESWKRYRGGQTTPIWIADLKTSAVKPIPRDNSNDHYPMWVGDSVYFLSDRNGPMSLFACDTRSGAVSEVLHSDGFDFKTASAGPDAIVIEQFGAIKLYDLKTHTAHTVEIHVHGDLPATRPHFEAVQPKTINNFGLSPTGARAVFEVRGDIFSVPTDKGDIRNLTHSPGAADRDPAWSPNGKWIAYFTDTSGEYQLAIRDQSGQDEPRLLSLSDQPSFFYEPRWSPDSRKIVFTDKRLKLWWIDLDTGKRHLIDTDRYGGGFGGLTFSAAWSPDSRWISYTRKLPSRQEAVFLYSLDQDKSWQVTDGMSDTESPVFDANGRYLYFTASTTVGLTAAGLDMTSDEHPVTRSVYAAVLSRDEPSPVAPQSDEDKGAAKPESPGKDDKKKPDADKAKKGDKPDETPKVRVDFDGIGQRIVALPIPARNFTRLSAGKSGVLFLAEAPTVVTQSMAEETHDDVPMTLHRFDLATRKFDKFLDGVNDFVVSFDGNRLLYRQGESYSVSGGDEPYAPGPKPVPGLGPLKLAGWQMYVDPKPTWQQVYDEAWRIERDFFYDPHYHGLDLDKAKKKYAPYLAGIASRGELTYLFNEAMGELTVGHLFVDDPEEPDAQAPPGGLLGADYTLEQGRYRFARVYDGENWNPHLQAPLTQPGVNVKAGDYLLAVNSRELKASDDVYAALQGTAGKQVVIKVGASANGSGAREVTVVPVASEAGLRHLAWVEGNRRKVDQATHGRVAYVYVPNTAGGGFTSFNRYFFSQVGKEAVIVDERFNKGGQLADYIIDYLGRPLRSMVAERDGEDWPSPTQAIFGPKVMIINEMSGSGGDALPWYFRKAGLGPLIGKRTWGGLVGIGGYPELIDGGSITAPRAAIYGLKGDWEVENHGVAPDIDVELDPAADRAGHDSQLDKAIEVVMQQLKEHPVPRIPRPAYPNYHRTDDLGTGR